MTADGLCRLGEAVTVTGGAVLRTDVYLPDAPPALTLLYRTPYVRASLAWECLQWAGLGYACVVQEVRSTPDAGAQLEWGTEVEHGRATLDWIAGQPWSDQRVVLIGTAAEVGPTVAAAQSGHGSVVGVVVIAPGSVSSSVPSGLPLLEWPVWSALSRQVGRSDDAGILDALEARDPVLLSRLPVTAVEERVGLPPGALAPTGSTSALRLRADGLRAVSVPTLHVSSWYDPLLSLGLEMHDVAGIDVRPRPARTQVIGPWAFPEHLRLAAQCDLDFAGADEQPPQSHVLEWLECLRSRRPFPPSQWFVTGANHWTPAPPSGGQAESSRVWYPTEDGRLSEQSSSEASTARFDSDPLDPCPSLPHSADQAGSSVRTDVASFTTATLQEPLSWAHAHVELQATSTAPTTDWIVRLLKVLPDGRAHQLGLTGVEAPGTARSHRLAFPLHPVALTPGDRLRLEVSSSWFPYYARNLQSGYDRWGGTRSAVGTQCVAVGASGTRLILNGAT